MTRRMQPREEPAERVLGRGDKVQGPVVDVKSLRKTQSTTGQEMGWEGPAGAQQADALGRGWNEPPGGGGGKAGRRPRRRPQAGQDMGWSQRREASGRV